MDDMEVGSRLDALKNKDKRSATMYGPDLLKTGAKMPELAKTGINESNSLA